MRLFMRPVPVLLVLDFSVLASRPHFASNAIDVLYAIVVRTSSLASTTFQHGFSAKAASYLYLGSQSLALTTASTRSVPIRSL